MQIKLHGLVEESIVDGPGFRTAIFTQGCPHHCPGCHNPSSHDPNGGIIDDTMRIIRIINANTIIDGITLTGGEPFMQCEACLELAQAAHDRGLTVWCYTGYLCDDLLTRPDARPLLNQIDVLIDGPFTLAQRSLDLRFRGSLNQRIIDLPTTLRENKIVLKALE